MFHDPAAAALCDQENILAMPQLENDQRVVYHIIEYEPLLDSSDMTFENYARIALDIQANYLSYDGFVVLHGTDTMAYTASALSFMLENLGKPIILTGSQIPVCEVRSDGRDNFLCALILAGLYNIPEVTVAFNNVLLRGNRSTKIDSDSLDAFKSPNIPPLAELGVNIHVQWEAIFMHSEIDRLRVHTEMCHHVTVLRIVPGMSLDTIRAVLQPPVTGVVLHTFGTGNAPTSRQELLDIIKSATERGVIIVNITQCLRGSVAVSYATGKALQDAGVLSGGDMTVEAALMKMSYVLSKDEWSIEKKREMMCTNLRGEMKSLTNETTTDTVEFALIGRFAEALRLSSSEEKHVLQSAIFPPLTCSAARRGDIDQLKQLKAAGATFMQADYDGRTALHIACSEGHLAVVKYLITNGASVHARDRYGHVPLDDAIRFNHHDVIEMLIRAGANITCSTTDVGVHLCSVVVRDGVHGLESWRLAGANLGQGDYCGRTAMHVAAAIGNGEVVEYLLQNGVKGRVADSLGITPVSEARRRGHTSIISLFERRNSLVGLN